MSATTYTGGGGGVRSRLPAPRRSQPWSVPVARKPAFDREQFASWWHPDRLGVESAPEYFDAQLKALHPGLAATKFPITGHWLLWSRKPDITHPICPGWLLLFVWKEHDGAPAPLDSRVMYNLYRRDPRRYRNAKQYFDLAEKELKEAKERREAAMATNDAAKVKEFTDYTKIKNIGHGSKSALHHDGTIAPSRGELNWLADRGGILGRKRTRER